MITNNSSRNISDRKRCEGRGEDGRRENPQESRDLAARSDQLIGGRRFTRETPAQEANRQAIEIIANVRCSVFSVPVIGTVSDIPRRRRRLAA